MMIDCFGTVHTVQPGETLWLISLSHGISVDKIVAANPYITRIICRLVSKFASLQIAKELFIP